MAGPSTVTVVLDASALLAVLQNEAGTDVVVKSMRSAILSAVNLSETIAKAGSKTGRHATLYKMIDRFDIRIIPFDREEAALTAELRERTHGKNVSFADSACLSLALQHGLPVLTGDRKWQALDLGIDIRLIR